MGFLGGRLVLKTHQFWGSVRVFLAMDMGKSHGTGAVFCPSSFVATQSIGSQQSYFLPLLFFPFSSFSLLVCVERNSFCFSAICLNSGFATNWFDCGKDLTKLSGRSGVKGWGCLWITTLTRSYQRTPEQTPLSASDFLPMILLAFPNSVWRSFSSCSR